MSTVRKPSRSPAARNSDTEPLNRESVTKAHSEKRGARRTGEAARRERNQVRPPLARPHESWVEIFELMSRPDCMMRPRSPPMVVAAAAESAAVSARLVNMSMSLIADYGVVVMWLLGRRGQRERERERDKRGACVPRAAARQRCLEGG